MVQVKVFEVLNWGSGNGNERKENLQVLTPLLKVIHYS